MVRRKCSRRPFAMHPNVFLLPVDDVLFRTLRCCVRRHTPIQGQGFANCGRTPLQKPRVPATSTTAGCTKRNSRPPASPPNTFHPAGYWPARKLTAGPKVVGYRTVRVTTPFAAATPIFGASMLGRHSSSSRTSCCNWESAFIGCSSIFSRHSLLPSKVDAADGDTNRFRVRRLLLRFFSEHDYHANQPAKGGSRVRECIPCAPNRSAASHPSNCVVLIPMCA